jgi:hypothetical protein
LTGLAYNASWQTATDAPKAEETRGAVEWHNYAARDLGDGAWFLAQSDGDDVSMMSGVSEAVDGSELHGAQYLDVKEHVCRVVVAMCDASVCVTPHFGLLPVAAQHCAVQHVPDDLGADERDQPDAAD